jgi:hypothetical protein
MQRNALPELGLAVSERTFAGQADRIGARWHR